ncbi:Protein kinase of the Mitotic Exit Network [Basidiobolus ranarum]|uniref:Protein kinase of the Mitotic Exit Network n=1 Tax=Basidiobolus ranarum TaxID=34480 RepID=A0ABR2W0V2_9FUNG
MTSLGSSNNNRFSSLDTKKSQEVVDKARAEQQLKNQLAAQHFLETVLGYPFPEVELYQSLRDGVLLCKMLNKLKPGAIPQISTKKMPFFQMQNISHFLEACSKLGLQKFDLFETVDLYEKKNMSRVIFTILTIERIIAGVPLSRRAQSYNELIHPNGNLKVNADDLPNPLPVPQKDVAVMYDEKLQSSPKKESFESYSSSISNESECISRQLSPTQTNITLRKKKHAFLVTDSQPSTIEKPARKSHKRASSTQHIQDQYLSDTFESASVSSTMISPDSSPNQLSQSHLLSDSFDDSTISGLSDDISPTKSIRSRYLSEKLEEKSPEMLFEKVSPTKLVRPRCLSENFEEGGLRKYSPRKSPTKTIRSRCLSERKHEDFDAEEYISNALRRSDSNQGGRTATVKERLEVFSEVSQIISQYQMGNRIGKGQFGTVYKALNLENGQMVAVKRMKIADHKEHIDSLMNEVDLLKSLSHPQIVTYEGSIRTDDSLYIVIEYVENGSMLKTLKDFGGRFPEKLVRKYALKILEGLMYLHDQEVVHCDLKAANILSTKSGNIKLSDFGVSLNLKLLESNLTNVSANPTVAGTPNWMAPEIIELQGASTASDIWSLGCTIIELLTGKPPYYDLMPLTALFRIVEDDCPPLPDNISNKLRTFLLQCFQKDPKKRPTARDLYHHQWLVEDRVVHELRKNGSIRSIEKIAVHVEGSPFHRSLPSPSGRMDNIISHDRTKSDTDAMGNPPRFHRFVKCSFNKAVVECRICQEFVKKRAFFCDDCGLVCHVECANSNPLVCEPRTPSNTPIHSLTSSNSRRIHSTGLVRHNNRTPTGAPDDGIYENGSSISSSGSNYQDNRFSRFRARGLMKSKRPPQDCCVS